MSKIRQNIASKLKKYHSQKKKKKIAVKSRKIEKNWNIIKYIIALINLSNFGLQKILNNKLFHKTIKNATLKAPKVYFY